MAAQTDLCLHLVHTTYDKRGVSSYVKVYGEMPLASVAKLHALPTGDREAANPIPSGPATLFRGH